MQHNELIQKLKTTRDDLNRLIANLEATDQRSEYMTDIPLTENTHKIGDKVKYINDVRYQGIPYEIIGFTDDTHKDVLLKNMPTPFRWNALIPVKKSSPAFKIGDMVQPIVTLEPDNAYLVPGSTNPNPILWFVPENRNGIVESCTEYGANTIQTNEGEYRINFGGYGIWYVIGDLLQLREEGV